MREKFPAWRETATFRLIAPLKINIDNNKNLKKIWPPFPNTRSLNLSLKVRLFRVKMKYKIKISKTRSEAQHSDACEVPSTKRNSIRFPIRMRSIWRLGQPRQGLLRICCLGRCWDLLIWLLVGASDVVVYARPAGLLWETLPCLRRQRVGTLQDGEMGSTVSS